jgi:hypothetical protein
MGTKAKMIEEWNKAILDLQKEIVSENFVGIDYSAIFPATTVKSTVAETENFVGVFVKGEW